MPSWSERKSDQTQNLPQVTGGVSHGAAHRLRLRIGFNPQDASGPPAIKARLRRTWILRSRGFEPGKGEKTVGKASGASEISPMLGRHVTSAGKKIAAKVAATVAVSGSVFVLSATSATASPVPASAVALAGPQAAPAGCGPPSLAHCYTEETITATSTGYFQ